MSEWQKLALGELIERGQADLQTGPFGTMLNSSEYVPSGIPVIAVQDIGNNRLIHEKVVFVNEATAKRLERYRVKNGDIIFGRKGAVDRRAIVNKFEEGWLQGSDCIRLRLNDAVDSRFVSYQFGSDLHKEWMFQQAGGATMPSLNQQILKLLPITLPPLSEQRAITAVLSSLDDKIDLLHRQNKTLESMAQTLFRHWFVEGTAVDWEEGTLGDVIEIYDSRRIPLSKMERDKMKDGQLFPYYGAATIMDYVNQYIFDGEYILMGEDGTVRTDEGYPILQYATGKFWVNNHAHIFQAKKPYSNFYIWCYLRKKNIDEIVTGAVQPKINQSNLKSLDFLMPPIQLVTQFVETTEVIQHKIKTNNLQIQTLEKLRDTLLPKLMSGEVRVRQ